ncbi:bacillithiol biosynthesis deacetylase BshB2 [Anaerobacillus sp. MEB173]|uniref:bacillithiol biosynthesis deacetylase BshB2 n=1 Tax=Anaerobacillus sp. MEB173 TaxID=3383345 RepID=UPI003F91FEAC
MEKHILVIFPHPDDEAFGVSGTMALHIESGIPVTYVCLTLGEMGRNMGNPPVANRRTLPMIREEELNNACKAIGLTDLRKMGMHDKTIEFEDKDKLAEQLYSVIEEINPSLIITFYPGYSVHPDHNATGEAVVYALKRLAIDERPTLYCLAFSHNSHEELGEPDVHIDVSSVIDKKLNCIQSHRSQISGFEGLVPELSRKLEERDPELINFIKNERFWTYRWED